MKLMIIESPGKGKKLRQILAKLRPNENWRVEPSVGHVRDLPASGVGADQITTGVRCDYTPIYEVTKRSRETVSKLKTLAASADEIYLATDPDREGESISWHLKEVLHLKKPIRITFNELTETKVREALSAPRTIDMQRVAAQEARRVLDRLVGYMVTSELRRQTGESLTAGRVQSTALYLVVLRERAIRVFKVIAHFGARLHFSTGQGGERWTAEWLTSEGFVSSANPYFQDRRVAQMAASVRNVVVRSFDERDAFRNPPAPFTTSTLQQAASNALDWDPDRCMQVAQKLYEQGNITYHRTDNPNISDDAMPAIRAVAHSLGLEAVEQRRIFEIKSEAQEGHPAITPTHWEIDAAGEDSEQKQLYELIRLRAIASQLAAARYKVRTVVATGTSQLEGKSVVFGAKGRTLIYPGWLKLLANDATEEDEEPAHEVENPIPVLAAGQPLIAIDGEVIDKKTKCPARYTKASLVKALEAEGIGRPSTYASILSKISKYGYVGPSGKRYLKALELGELVIDRLEGKFTFLDVSYTRGMEKELDRIAKGEIEYRTVIEKLHTVLAADLDVQRGVVKANSVASIPKQAPVENKRAPRTASQKGSNTSDAGSSCPSCTKGALVKRSVKKGDNVGKTFLGCTNFPTCKHFQWAKA